MALSVSAQAQQRGRLYRLGFLSPATPPEPSSPAASTLVPKLLHDSGYVEGQNLQVQRRFAAGKLDRLPQLANELVDLRMDVIVAVSPTAIQPALDATKNIPIVMGFGKDPVRDGLIASLARPGGNITSLSRVNIELSAKRLELLKETVPSVTRVAVLFNPEGRIPGLALKEARAAAQRLKLHIQSFELLALEDIEPAFRSASRERASAFMTLPGGFIGFYRRRIVELAAKSGLPAIYNNARFVDDGGLMGMPRTSGRSSYGRRCM